MYSTAQNFFIFTQKLTNIHDFETFYYTKNKHSFDSETEVFKDCSKIKKCMNIHKILIVCVYMSTTDIH